jgi:hypothetical protein
MVGPSASRALMEVEQMTVLNEVLDDEILSNYSSDDDSASDYDFLLYTAISQFSRRMNSSRRHFLERISPMGKMARPPRKCVVFARKGQRKESQY